ncbi:MAG: CocE/NonD family hydrolase [Bacteroidia bacterium]|nr:CocE/NonD family hydrolase [Bacteroidia bacterium]
MKRLLILLFAVLHYTFNAQIIDSTWLSKNYIKKEIMIPMRDGVKLFTSVYSPKDTMVKSPILMMRTPYSVAPYGQNRYSPLLSSSHFSTYAKEHFIIVLQDVRGTYMSEGEFMDIRPFIDEKKNNKDIDEASDAYDAIDWLVKNVAANNGKVGVTGISYPGFYASMAMLCGHPALKAVSPQAPVTDWFHGDDFHHNGAFALADAFNFFSGFGRPRYGPTKTRPSGYKITEKDIYTFHLKQGALKNLKKILGDSIQFWNDMVKHPNYDEWWKDRDIRNHIKSEVQPAVLVVGGNFEAEECYGAWNLYKSFVQTGLQNKFLAVGPWFHGGWHRSDGSYLGNVRFGSKTSEYYKQNIEVPFFMLNLTSKPPVKKPFPVTVYFTGENVWRMYDTWPPANSYPFIAYLNENKSITFTKPVNKTSFSTYTSNPANPVPYEELPGAKRSREYMTDDQRFASNRPDVLTFQTEPLRRPMILAGPIAADLKVNVSSTDVDFIVKIIDVFPDDFKYDTMCCKGVKQEAKMSGYQMLVRAEIIRGKFRNSFEKPEPFDTTKTETVRLLLPDVTHTIKPGHRLMVQIQSSWFPLFDMNPQTFTNIYTCDDKDFVQSRIKVFHQADAASNIILSLAPPQQ